MHVHFLDPYRQRNSPVHALDPRLKLVLTLGFILTTALVPPGAWPVYILLLAIILSVEIISDLGMGNVLKRSALALPFVLAAVPILFTTPGPELWSVQIGPWTLGLSAAGLERFASIAAKSWISVQAAIVLASSTPFPDLLAAMRAIRVPRMLVAIFSLMWRYLFVLVDEALRLLRARASRSGKSGQSGLKTGGSLAWRGRVAGGMAGNLFLRAYERSDRIYMAMLSRGYDGEIRSEPLPRLGPGSWLLLGISLSIYILLLLFSFLF
jgi:cobalt/nickel transport system permease protein